MRKTLLLMLAFLQVSFAAQAQEKTEFKIGSKALMERKADRPLVLPGTTPRTANASTRIAMDEDERIMGFYTSDEYGDPNSALGLKVNHYIAAVEFFPSDIKRMVGGEITKVRFAINGSIGASKVYVYSIDNLGNFVDSYDPVEVASTKNGWNDVVLPTPIPVKENMSYMIGYEVNNAATKYPLLTDSDINPGGASEGGLLIYGDLGEGEYWYTFGTDYGNLCIQAVVKGGTHSENDVSINGLSTNKYVKSNSNFEFNFNIRNSGMNAVSSCVLSVYIDGTSLGTLNVSDGLSSNYQNISVNAELPDGLSIGKHELMLTVDAVNGVVPSEDFGESVTKTEFVVYENAMTRNYNLVEQFTSQRCTFCPLGYNVLNALEAKRNDIAWVSLHGSGMGDDEYNFADVDYIDYFVGGGAYPSAAFNRYYVNDKTVNSSSRLGLSLGYSAEYTDQAAEMFSQIIDMSNTSVPAFASIDVATEYDASSRKLNVKVTSEAAEGFDKLVGDAAITVYLLEDGLVSKQLNNGAWDYNFTHNHVLRDILTSYYGDAVTWTDGKVEMDFSTVLDSEWNPEKMEVVAFIGRPIILNGSTFETTFDDAFVLNTNKVGLGGTTGIEGVDMDEADVKEVARYTIDGVRISAPQKGVNIVKMSNGKVYKVLVK